MINGRRKRRVSSEWVHEAQPPGGDNFGAEIYEQVKNWIKNISSNRNL